MDIILLLLLTGINGFFALAEIAVVTARPTRLQKMKKENVWGAKAALHLQKDPKYFLSTIQVGITLVVLVMGVLSGTQLSEKLASIFLYLGWPNAVSQPLSLVLSLFFITYISILLGELLPKTIALSKPEKVASRIAPIANVLSFVFYPFAKLLAISTGGLTRLLGFKDEGKRNFTASELRQMVRLASEEGVIDDAQKTLHEKVFYFADKRARHLMTHADELEWVDLWQSHEEINRQILRFKHSKIICIRGRLSQIAGIIKQREYLKAYAKHAEPDLLKLMDEAHFIDEFMAAEQVLQFMRKSNISVCLVTRKGAEVVGLISLSDIFEALVGKLATTEDPYEPPFFKRYDGSFLISGDAPIEVLDELLPNFTIDFSQIVYSSVGGYINAQLKNAPKIGDRIRLHQRDFEIMDIDGRYIDKILLFPPSNS
jgi:putative hemolysin